METSDSQNLASLSDEYWDARMRNNPVFATALGDRRFDDLLDDIRPEAVARFEQIMRSFAERRAKIRGDELSPGDRITFAALGSDIQAALDRTSCHLEEWTVDPLGGPQVDFQNLEAIQPVRTPAEGAAMVRRCGAMGPYFDDQIANMRRGAAEGKLPVRICVEKAVDQIRELLSRPDADWPLLKPLAVQHPDWIEDERKRFREDLKAVLASSVRTGYEKYLAFLASEVMPNARPQDRPGIVHVPGGAECYSKLIMAATSLRLTAEELYQTGLREVARINAETAALGEKVFGTPDRRETIRRLRTDSSLYFSSRDEVAEKAEAALKRAKAAIPRWFGRLPKADCIVARMEEHEEKYNTIAYYRQPAMDGSVPGRYYINTSEPETRPRYEAEALAYHESIPGHHLQIAIAQELEGIPKFRRNLGVTAFVEGWGLYSERLADLMGLYSSDLDRLGMLSYDSWRACRLVVDTGMHAMGWSREQAIGYMFDNSALAKNNIVNEVDRYISWPGQAVAYKTGQLEMLSLRSEAMKRLGAGFDYRKFHDALLGNGALPLGTLRDVVSGSLAGAD